MKKVIKWIGISLGVCLLLAVIAAIASPNKKAADQPAPAAQASVTPSQADQAAQSAPAAPTATQAPQPTATPLPAVGTDVTVGKIRWKVLKVENLGQVLKSDNQFIDDLKTSGFYVRVSYEVENQNSDPMYYQAPKLIDSQQRKFDASTDSSYWIPDDEQCILEKLNPNIVKTCTSVYELPAGANGITASLSSFSLLGGADKPVDLGLQQE
jgi:hypothetical protein